jgi:hypothetical protein
MNLSYVDGNLFDKVLVPLFFKWNSMKVFGHRLCENMQRLENIKQQGL